MDDKNKWNCVYYIFKTRNDEDTSNTKSIFVQNEYLIENKIDNWKNTER